MTALNSAIVARVLGHDRFTIRGGSEIWIDGLPGEFPNYHPPLTEEEIATAQAALDAEEAAAVPEVVSARQARLALIGAGLLDAVETAIAALPSAADRVEWEYATEIRRDHPLIASLGVALSLSTEDIDDLFRIAGMIV